jgi:FO synthase
MATLIRGAGRVPRQRTTLYGHAPSARVDAAFDAPALTPVVASPVTRRRRDRPAAE